MRYKKDLGLGFWNCDADVTIEFSYTPGCPSEGPEINILGVEVHSITRSNSVLTREWLDDRGWYDFAKRAIKKELDVLYEPGGSIWWDLREAVWD